MRTCPVCDSLIPHDSCTCPDCGTKDYAWRENLETSQCSATRRFHRKTIFAEEVRHTQHSGIAGRYLVRLSAFSDSGELGFHLFRIKKLASAVPDKQLTVTLDASSWAYDWDYSDEADPESDYYLPPSFPILSLIETSRFVRSVEGIAANNIRIELILPPRDHPITLFLRRGAFYRDLVMANCSYSDHGLPVVSKQGCDNVLVPLTRVDGSTNGQLTQTFHENFDALATAGLFEDVHRSSIRRVIMEAAENADIWGNGGWVSCFLRQEKRGAANFGHKTTIFDPSRETHLFINVFSLGATIGSALNMATEWEAADAVTIGWSSRGVAGGKGFPHILSTITRLSLGTVFISSGAYTRIHSPDGLIREHLAVGSDYLPGVHLCAVIPVAVISKINPDPAIAKKLLA